MDVVPTTPETVSTGIKGLDYILNGGVTKGKTFFVQGDPGVGKTTLALHFVMEGAAVGERTLYITISQSAEDLQQIAQTHGWDLEGVDVLELSRQRVAEGLARRQSILRTEDVELSEMTTEVRTAIEHASPDRLVFDSIGALRILAGGQTPRYREEVNLFLQLVHEAGATALVLDDMPASGGDLAFETMAHGVVKLFYESNPYGDRRTLRVLKMRGRNYMGGDHSFKIRPGRLEVYPRLRSWEGESYDDWRTFSSGVSKLDEMLDGGLDAGTTTLFLGGTGTGKTSVATLFLNVALKAGERAAAYLFDERPATFLRRAARLQVDLEPYLESGQFLLRQIETGEISVGEFGHTLRVAADEGVSVILIDSLTGYANAMKDDELLLAQLHEMLTYLSRRGILSLLVVTQQGVNEDEPEMPVSLSYMADTVIFLRLYQAEGMLHKAISVLKKRHSDHARSIHDLRMGPDGVAVGGPLTPDESFLQVGPVFAGPLRDSMRDGDGE